MSSIDRSVRYPRLRKIYNQAQCVFEDNVTYVLTVLFYLGARIRNNNKKIILFYPEKPVWYHVLYQICRFNSFAVTNKPQKADAMVYFKDATYGTYDTIIRKLSKKNTVINYRCQDISKKRVDEIHTKVFGYGLTVNPQTYKGKYVKKGNMNSLHNGVILDHPEEPEEGCVYQLLVNNEVNGELVEIRLPIFKQTIPFAYLKYRPIESRFRSNSNRVKLVKEEQVISKHESGQIRQFCQLLGLDCGELDVLRDTETKKLYIVDANNTPAGPPYQLPLADYKKTLHMLSDAFQNAFL